MDIIEINKSLIPYDFNIALGGELFNFRVDYNTTGGFFTLELKKDGETLCSGELIVYGKRLFSEFKKPNFPMVDIIPFDPSGGYNSVTYNNLCDVVLLAIDDGTIGG